MSKDGNLFDVPKIFVNRITFGSFRCYCSIPGTGIVAIVSSLPCVDNALILDHTFSLWTHESMCVSSPLTEKKSIKRRFIFPVPSFEKV